MDFVKYIRKLVGNHKIIMNAAACIITDSQDRILLQLRGDDHTWGLPCGIMEMNETLEETSIREVQEETGLDIEIIRPIGPFYNMNKTWPNGDEAHVICFVYEGKVIGGKLTIDGEETLDLQYFDVNHLPLIGAIDHHQAIQAYYSNKHNSVVQ